MAKSTIRTPEGEMGYIPSVPDLDTVDLAVRARHLELVSAANHARSVVNELSKDHAKLGEKAQAAVAYQAAGIAIRAYESFHPELTQGNVSGQHGQGTEQEA